MNLFEVLFPLLWAVFLAYLIRRWSFARHSGVSSRIIWLVFGLKIMAGLALWALYTHYPPYRAASDLYGYYDDAMVLHRTLWQDPQIWWRFMLGIDLQAADLAPYFDQMTRWTNVYTYGIANDNPTIIRLNMLVALVSFGAFHVHTVIFSFLSLTGLLAITRFLVHFSAFDRRQQLRDLIFAAVALSPTVLFWSSGVLKEAPLIATLGLVLFSALKLRMQRWRYLPMFVLTMLIGFVLKPYVIITLIPGLTAFFISARKRWMRNLRYPAAAFACYLIASFAQAFFPAGNLQYILHKKQQDFYNVAAMHDAGSVVKISAVDQHPMGFLLDAPERFWHAYFRPFVHEIEGFFYLIPAAESTVLLLLLALVISFRILNVSSLAGWQVALPVSELTLFIGTFAVTFALVMGSCVPVLGAVVRYRLPVYALFFGYFALCIGRRLTQRSASARQE